MFTVVDSVVPVINDMQGKASLPQLKVVLHQLILIFFCVTLTYILQ